MKQVKTGWLHQLKVVGVGYLASIRLRSQKKPHTKDGSSGKSGRLRFEKSPFSRRLSLFPPTYGGEW